MKERRYILAIYGYARVSSSTQNLDTQLKQLNDYGVDEIIQEKITSVSRSSDRELYRLLEKINEGDLIVITRMDRIARSVKQLLEIVSHIDSRKANILSLDHSIDNTTPTGRLFTNVLVSIYQWELEMLKEKQARGIAEAKRSGKHLGRPRGFTLRGLDQAIVMYEEGALTVKEIAEITQVSKASLYRALQERRIERNRA
jgi:DNA invertase Pin-like site-specific DNA recombinase